MLIMSGSSSRLLCQMGLEEREATLGSADDATVEIVWSIPRVAVGDQVKRFGQFSKLIDNLEAGASHRHCCD